MAFDKAKVVRAAEKFLAQGKIAAAIKEYRQIVDNDDDDFTALNMLGDLYARSGKGQDAIACFSRIANHYREQGFALKAISMFKKIDRLQPNDPEIAKTLGALYEMQGLVVDARAQYMSVAESFQRAGQQQKALDVLRKVADLEPQNTENRIKLALGYLKENLRPEAAEAYADAGEQFLSRRNFERAIECYSETLKLTPRNHIALSGLLNAHIALGTADEAAEILEQALADAPGDVELLSMLGHAYIEAEDAERAERAIQSLAAVEDSSCLRFLDVARLYLKGDGTERAISILSDIADRILAEGEIDRLMRLLDEVLARNPEHLDGLKLLVRVNQWQGDPGKTRGVLERLVDTAEAFENVEVERWALAQLVQIVPDARYLDRLEKLGGAPSGMFVDKNRPSEQAVISSYDGFALIDDHVAASSGQVAGDHGNDFEWNAVSEQVHEPGVLLSDSVTEAAVSEESLFETNSADSFVGNAPAASETHTESRHDGLLNQELESVDFYIAQGYIDIAIDTLDMLERQFGRRESIDARRKALGGSQSSAEESAGETVNFSMGELSSPPSAEDTLREEANEFFMMAAAEESESEGASDFAFSVPDAQNPGATPGGIDSGLAAIFDEFREAVEDDEPASGGGDYETHYNMGIAYKEMDLSDQAVEEFQQAVALVSPQDGTDRYLQCCNMLGHCFMQKQMSRLAIMWFKKGLEAPGHSEDEYQALRFELGLAHEQAGDIDAAIDVFSEVYGVSISYRGVGEKLRELQAQRAIK
jgi:tetratricopeptide (TPR) repeat protein